MTPRATPPAAQPVTVNVTVTTGQTAQPLPMARPVARPATGQAVAAVASGVAQVIGALAGRRNGRPAAVAVPATCFPVIVPGRFQPAPHPAQPLPGAGEDFGGGGDWGPEPETLPADTDGCEPDWADVCEPEITDECGAMETETPEYDAGMTDLDCSGGMDAGFGVDWGFDNGMA